MEHFRIDTEESVEILTEMRNAVNTASELVRKEIKLDHSLIFSHFREKETSKAVECIPIFKEDLVKADGSESFVREVGRVPLEKIEKARINFCKT